MVYSLTDDQEALRAQILRLCARFDDAYWLARDRDGVFPHEFHAAMAEGGWLGIAMPEDYGGAGLGMQEATVMMRAVAESGACMTGASAIHMNIFGLNPVVVFGTEAQKRRFLPPLIAGREKACFGVTEPNAGLNTTELKTRAEKRGDRYVVTGQKIWISTAQVADRILLLARTTPLDQVKRKTDGLSLFYTALDRTKVEVRLIEKMGRHAVDSNMLFFDGYEIPAEDRIGEEGQGFRMILHGMNPERMLIAAEAVGIGHAALRRASDYARQREVFGRPIGQNQAIQHPLARCWAHLEAAWLMTMKAASLYDAGQECGAESNAAKYLAGEAGFTAAETAVMTHGGMGYAQEYHVERYLRESLIPRIAPVSRELILSHLAERVLGLPKSY
ncbi:acyl-CoA dehydrogenase family protein [Roseomonas sp. HF4]|uniref:acyl-CoA dehydrogenase family protein n=1 Tax=Roseomonas sp. HF4 TaxID=2562313 RepID=UPI0010C02348|nr:acyl-CoA dehydrogenase family protein [Roseomonas sp. HF4]